MLLRASGLEVSTARVEATELLHAAPEGALVSCDGEQGPFVHECFLSRLFGAARVYVQSDPDAKRSELAGALRVFTRSGTLSVSVQSPQPTATFDTAGTYTGVAQLVASGIDDREFEEGLSLPITAAVYPSGRDYVIRDLATYGDAKCGRHLHYARSRDLGRGPQEDTPFLPCFPEELVSAVTAPSSALIFRRVGSSAAFNPSRRALTIGARRAASTSTSFAIFVSQRRSSVLAPFMSSLVPQVETSRSRSVVIRRPHHQQALLLAKRTVDRHCPWL